MALGTSDTGVPSGSWFNILKALASEVWYFDSLNLGRLTYGTDSKDRSLESSYSSAVSKAIIEGIPFPDSEAPVAVTVADVTTPHTLDPNYYTWSSKLRLASRTSIEAIQIKSTWQ